MPALVDMLTRALSDGTDADEHSTDERILDAALREAAAFGPSRMTIDDVARRAGVGRVTVFRRFGSKEALLERLMGREVRRFLASVDLALLAIEDPVERVAEAFVACVRASREHPMVARMTSVDPAALFAELIRGDPSPMELGRMFVAAHMVQAQESGQLPGVDPDEVADVLVRLALTYVLVPGAVLDVGDERAARDFARRALGPIVST